MGALDLTTVQADCAAETAREAYPADFPALPPIPAARYSDPQFHDLELAAVWRKTWLWAAHVSDLREAGACKVFDRLGESILVLRGDDGEIRAMHNVCMHRGSPLVTQPRGTVRRLVCPYHAWTYALDGSLQKIPEERNFACLDKADHGLMPVRCETWRGHVFINLDPQAGPLSDHLGSLPDYCREFPWENLEIKRYTQVSVACNWKVALDNFIEIYHIATVHPAIMRWLEVKSFQVTPLKGGHAYLRTKRRDGNRIVEDAPRTPDGDFNLFQTYAINLPIFPNIAGGLDAGGFNWTVFWPDGPDRTIIELPHFGAIGEDDAAYWDALMTESLRLIDEDLALLPGVHRAMVSGRLKALPLSYHERAIYWYNEEIDRRIGPERIAPALRVAPVLAAQGFG